MMTGTVDIKKKGAPAVGSTVCKFVIAAVLIGLVILPILQMFAVLKLQDIKDVFSNPKLPHVLLNTLTFTGAATVIVILLAYALAWSIQRTDIKLKGVFNVILVLPMLIPSVSHGMGIKILFGQGGLVSGLFGLDGTFIYGAPGIILGSVMYAFPVAFIMLSDVLRYEDTSVYQAADVLGIGRGRRFLNITLPYLRRPLIAAVFSTFAMIATDYGVPMMLNTPDTETVSLLMYKEVISQLKFGRGCVYGIILLIPAIVAFVTDMLNKDKASTSFVKKQEGARSGLGKNILGYAFCIVTSVIALLPIAAFALRAFVKKYPSDMSFTFDNVVTTMTTRGGDKFLINSLIIAVATAVIGTLIGFITAYLTSRVKGGISRVLHLLVLTFMAIPGIVLGLSYVIAFSGSFIEGTIVILAMVNVAHFVSSPYLMMYNTFGKMNENLEAVGETLGIGRVRMLKDVFLPMSFGTIVEMFSYLFVNCMMTISAVSFLASSSTKPISLMINQFEAQMQYESVAVVSLVILLVNIILKAVIGILKNTVFNYRKGK